MADVVVEQEHVIPAGTLRQVPLKDITVPPRFRVDLGNMDSLIASIREKGILQPITLDKKLNLLAGGRRFAGATQAGLTKIPALIREISGEIDAREIELFENIHRKDFTWQEETALTAEIDRLYKEQNVDWSGRKTAALLDKGVASVSRALQLARAIEVLPEIGEQKTADDAFKMLKQFEEQAIIDELIRRQRQGTDAVLALGIEHTQTDQWDSATKLQIAEANYRIGDTFAGLADLQDSGMIHLIECDPPYGINLNEVKSSKDSADSNVTSYQEISTLDYPNFLSTLSRELYRVAGRDCWLIFWFGPTWHAEVRDSLKLAGWQVDDIPAIWVKKQAQTLQPELYLARGYEPFFLCRKGKPVMAKRGRINVFDFPATPPSKKYHPTERPIELMDELLQTLGIASQTVLVPFLGSGVTLRSAYRNNMKGFGWDMNPEYRNRFMLAVEEDQRVLSNP